MYYVTKGFLIEVNIFMSLELHPGFSGLWRSSFTVDFLFPSYFFMSTTFYCFYHVFCCLLFSVMILDCFTTSATNFYHHILVTVYFHEVSLGASKLIKKSAEVCHGVQILTQLVFFLVWAPRPLVWISVPRTVM